MKHLKVPGDDAVRRLLDEAEVAPSDQLTSSLLALRAAGEAYSAPEPSEELMHFMTTTATAPVVPLRRRRNVRGALMVAAALAGTGLGVSGVAAANPDFRAAADQAVQNVVGFFAPSPGKAEAPDDAELGRPAGVPAAPGQDESDNSSTEDRPGSAEDAPANKEPDSATDATDATEQVAPGRSLAPGQQTDTPGQHHRSVTGGHKGVEHPPASPLRGVLPGAPPLDGELPAPTTPDPSHEHPGKNFPLEDGSLPSPDPAQIPELPTAPEPQR